MKKLDKLILKSFLGPFLLTFVVVVFILLSQTMIKYFDDFAGKGLGLEVFAELIFYFAVFTTPVALPLAILLSSLMTFGNLGEHSELTAIKSSGISLIRALSPIFVVTVFFSILAYFNNNYIVPKANLKAYSLLYDIKTKKPALDLKEGTFYNGIRGLSIKVNEKDGDGGLKDVIIYDHREGGGNSNTTMAEAGKMYTILNERYLILELFNGRVYNQLSDQNRGRHVPYNEVEPYRIDQFTTSKLVLSLAEFEFNRTDEDLFRTNRLMLNESELIYFIDSLRKEFTLERYNVYHSMSNYLPGHVKNKLIIPEKLSSEKKRIDSLKNEYYRKMSEQMVREMRDGPEVTDSADNENRRPLFGSRKRETKRKPDIPVASAPYTNYPTSIYGSPVFGSEYGSKIYQAKKVDSLVNLLPAHSIQQNLVRIDSAIQEKNNYDGIITTAIEKARVAKSQISSDAERLDNQLINLRKYEIEKHKKFAQAFACLVMFLVGAPLGSIIKKGGLGIPVILSIMFFIIYYVLSMTGEKWARQSLIAPFWGVWNSNLILLPMGLFFLKQARVDARLFDADFYNVVFSKIKEKLANKRKNMQ